MKESVWRSGKLYRKNIADPSDLFRIRYNYYKRSNTLPTCLFTLKCRAHSTDNLIAVQALERVFHSVHYDIQKIC